MCFRFATDSHPGLQNHLHSCGAGCCDHSRTPILRPPPTCAAPPLSAMKLPTPTSSWAKLISSLLHHPAQSQSPSQLQLQLQFPLVAHRFLPLPCRTSGASLLSHRRFCAGSSSGDESDSNQDEFHDFPGAKAGFTSKLKHVPETPEEPVPCFRILDEYGRRMKDSHMPEIDKAFVLKIYQNMVTLQAMDSLFFEAQRQGRFSFYLTSFGEEAITIASAAALSDDDMVYAQYREPGVLMWRGFTLNEFANQCFSNDLDYGKGRQMPVHYGSAKLNYATVSSPIATQLPHAVGAAYAFKMDQKPLCSATYFGEGATSEGDFHGAMNFAAVLEVPVLFICRNNGYAISTPANEQFKSDGVVGKGQAYGMRSFRVDGNDALAVYATVNAARKMAVEESRPILIEALTYRVGHHSTSDDSGKYRKGDEMHHWKTVRDPVVRLRRWLEGEGWWDADADQRLRADTRNEVISAMQRAGPRMKQSLANLFTDVYDTIPSNLRQQEKELRSTVGRHRQDYPTDVPL